MSDSSTTLIEENVILHRIIDAVSYNLDLDDTLREIIAVVNIVAKADEIFIYLVRDHLLEMRAALHERPEDVGSIHMELGQGVTGWVAEHKEPVVLIEQAYDDQRFHVFGQLKADKYEAFCSIPMLYRDELIGVLNVQHKEENELTDLELQLLQTIANATAGALKNAQLFEENLVLSQALEARKTIERAKGIMMEEEGMTEEEAYHWLKKRAMDKRKSMQEIAEAVLISRE